jgi:hypothetical protein
VPDLTLLCPGTLSPAPRDDTRADAPLDALLALLRRARIVGRWHDADAVPLELPHERWLRRQFGIPAGASIEAASAAFDGVRPPAWRLTPVHLHVARDHLVLTDPARLALEPQDGAELAGIAATVFAQQGWRLDARLNTGRWYLQGDDLSTLATRAWTLALGRNVDAWSPSGADARRWRKLLNEIQMLWHIAPANARRIERDLPAVNGLWLDGCTPSSVSTPAPFSEIASDDPALRGLAMLSGLRIAPAARVLPKQTMTDALLQVLDGWRSHLRDAEASRTLRGAAAQAFGLALTAGFDRLTVVLTGERGGVELSVARGDAWKVWRRLDATTLTEWEE